MSISAKAHRSIQRNILAGISVSALLVGSVAAWAFTTDISGAVVTTGQLVVDTNVRKVQHPTGGIVGEILAREGDLVNEGDVLVRLDATITRASLAIVSRGLDELRARKARLEAERDDQSEVTFPKELVDRSDEPDVAAIMSGERRLFQLRRTSQFGQKSQLHQRIVQLQKEIDGLTAQAAAKADEIELIGKELEGARTLWDKNLYPITKFTQLQREATRLDGERAQLIAAKAKSDGRVAETELQIVQVDRDLASEVARELRDADAKIGEYLERKVAAEDQLRRIEIRAPIDGVVYQSTVHTVGGVITASGEPIMQIVPQSDRLTVEAKVLPNNIDQVQVGQKATVRFPSFNQQTTPSLEGEVSRISADTILEERTGLTYYTVRISLSSQQTARLGDVKLLPGMPTEAFIRTADRKVISYLVKPLTDQFTRAFREE